MLHSVSMQTTGDKSGSRYQIPGPYLIDKLTSDLIKYRIRLEHEILLLHHVILS